MPDKLQYPNAKRFWYSKDPNDRRNDLLNVVISKNWVVPPSRRQENRDWAAAHKAPETGNIQLTTPKPTPAQRQARNRAMARKAKHQ